MSFLKKLFGRSSKLAPGADKKLTSAVQVAATSLISKQPVNPDLVALAEKYMGMDYPSGPMDAMLAGLGGQSVTKPAYTVASGGKIQRASQSLAGMGSPIDMKIVQVASCLQGRSNLNMFDPQSIAAAAMEAIKHYAALPRVRRFFVVPYEAKAGALRDGAGVPVKEKCRILAGVENLLLEIYEELPYDGSIITDALVENKIDRLVQSV